MSPDEPQGMGLDENQAAALALRVVAEWCRHSERPAWEDLPMIGEYAFERLCAAVVNVAGDLEGEANWFDSAFGFDSKALLDQARDVPHG